MKWLVCDVDAVADALVECGMTVMRGPAGPFGKSALRNLLGTHQPDAIVIRESACAPAGGLSPWLRPGRMVVLLGDGGGASGSLSLIHAAVYVSKSPAAVEEASKRRRSVLLDANIGRTLIAATSAGVYRPDEVSSHPVARPPVTRAQSVHPRRPPTPPARGRTGRSPRRVKRAATLLVYGFVRSGNHALGALVQRAFYPAVEPLTVLRSESGHWANERAELSRVTVDGEDADTAEVELPYGRLLGGHHLPPPRSTPAIYVHRDVRDVALSMWAWPKMRPPGVTTFSDFLRMDLDWRGSMSRVHPTSPGYTLVHHHHDHVAAWSAWPGVCVVRYEDLVTDRDGVLATIGAYLGREPLAVDDVGMSGWNAGASPRVERWRTEMEAGDVEFCDLRSSGTVSSFGPS